MKRIIIVLLFISAVGTIYFFWQKNQTKPYTSGSILSESINAQKNPLAIDEMRQKSYPGSGLLFEQTLSPGSDYFRFIVSYQSEGLKQFGLLTLPKGKKPDKGWPVILLNHGYISPPLYSTEKSYEYFVDIFASQGYIVFKPDYRGNGNSQGKPVQIYTSPDYLTDSMNALSSIKQYKDADPEKIGVFGHSMGGNIALHQIVISKDIKAAAIMAGVVGDRKGIIEWWDKRIKAKKVAGNDLDAANAIQHMIAVYGAPDSNPHYWNAIDPTYYIASITAPVLIQVGTGDSGVPPHFSSSLRDMLIDEGKIVDYHAYKGADHNLSPYLSEALQETVVFFDEHLK